MLNVRSGAPQGSVLSPLLFLVYINDIVDIFENGVEIKLFADDAKIYVVIDNIADCLLLQRGLDSLASWAEKWQLRISIAKCATIHIGSRNFKHVYSINSISLPSVESVVDLGVIVDSNLRFSKQVDSIVCKASQRSSLILRCFRSRDPFLLCRAFVVYVRPLIEYCSPVWAPCYLTDIRKIESVQRKFTRRLAGLKSLNLL